MQLLYCLITAIKSACKYCMVLCAARLSAAMLWLAIILMRKNRYASTQNNLEIWISLFHR